MDETSRRTVPMAAWAFYGLSAFAAFRFVSEAAAQMSRLGLGLHEFWWVRPAEMAVIAGACFAIARGIHTGRPWATWIRWPASIPKAVIFPALFLLVVAPLAVFVVSGAGTHMSPLLLYPFATPWWLLLRDDTGGNEIPALILGCAVNLLAVTLLGWALDRRAARRDAR